MTKIDQMVAFMKANPNATPQHAVDELGWDIKQVYLLRSQAKAKMKKLEQGHKNRLLTAKSQTSAKIEVPKEWEEDAQQMAEEVKSGKKCSVPDEKVTMLLNDSTKLLKELMEAKIIIKYLEAKLMGASS